MNSCDGLETLRCLDLDPEARAHLERCYPCGERAQELARLRSWAARQDDGWAGADPPPVDVDAALAAVWAGAPSRRPPRALQVTRLAAVGAAAALLAGIAGPLLLRLRVRGLPAPSPMPALVVSGEGQVLFWTSASR